QADVHETASGDVLERLEDRALSPDAVDVAHREDEHVEILQQPPLTRVELAHARERRPLDGGKAPGFVPELVAREAERRRQHQSPPGSGPVRCQRKPPPRSPSRRSPSRLSCIRSRRGVPPDPRSGSPKGPCPRRGDRPRGRGSPPRLPPTGRCVPLPSRKAIL